MPRHWPRKLRALLEVFLFEAAFLLSAWLLEPASGYGWYSKLLMILLALLGMTLHGFRGAYNPLPARPLVSIRWSVAIAALFLGGGAAALAAAMLLGQLHAERLSGLAIDLAWFLVFVGFAEELFFRGYVQARLNEAFTKEYRSFLGAPFTWHQGTLITGVLLFGLPHLLTAVNPFTGRLSIGPAALALTASACFMGVVWGVLKEKTGGVLLPAVFHGLLDFTTLGVGRATGLMLSATASALSLALFFAYMLQRILKDP